MSGICGIIRFGQQVVTQEEIFAMNLAMSCSGWDGAFAWHHDSVGLGFQAYHLTEDAIHSILPYYDSSTSIAITTDCRLDNRAMLCQQFNLKDEPGLSDSLLILYAYQKWGKACPTYLLGEFAVALWDERWQELICFVDHTGSRTFYYYHDAQLFAFATDILALHTLKNIHRKPNLQRIAAHGNVSYQLARPEMTCYEGVFKATARTLFVIKNKQLTRQIYWQPDINQRVHFTSEEEYIEAFQDVFSTIVRSKLRSHCPVLTLHSGGLDSSSITAMAALLLSLEGKQLIALSAVLPPNYQGDTVDENYYIQLLQKPNLRIQTVTDPWRGPFDGLEDNHRCMMGMNRSSRHYLYQAFATAASAQGARIILDGCYGEKGPSFHGNGYYAELLVNLRWRTLLRESRLHIKRYDRSWLKFAVREGLMPLLPAVVQEKMSLRSDIALSQQASFVKSAFIDAHVGGASFQHERLHLNTQYPSHRHHQHQAMQYLHANNSVIPDDNGRPVQFSYPYNDKRMLEFCLAMPGNLKVRHGYKRYAIRSGMRGLMPDELRFRTTKEPFSPDFHDRYNRQLGKARDFVANVRQTPLMQEIIDIPRLVSELEHTMQTNRCSTKRDFTAMHTIPFAIYLMAFLATFD